MMKGAFSGWCFGLAARGHARRVTALVLGQDGRSEIAPLFNNGSAALVPRLTIQPKTTTSR